MSNLRDRAAGRLKAWPALAVLLLLSAPGLLPGQEEPSRAARAASDTAAASSASLKATIEAKYEVLPTSGGLLLRPKQESAGVRSIELIGRAVAINGERMAPEVVRAWLQAEAEPVMRLRDLAPAERRRLFGLDTEGLEEVVPEAVSGTAEEGEVAAGPGLPEVPPAPEPPEPPAPPRRRGVSDTSIAFGSPVVVEPGETKEVAIAVGASVRVDGKVLKSAVATGGSVEVGETGEVGGDVTAFGEDVVIDGRVGGDVSSVGGDVRLGPTAVVSGNVSSAGGSVERDPGATVHGKVAELSGPATSINLSPFDFDFLPFSSAWLRLAEAMLELLLLGALLCLVLLVARRPHDRVAARIAADPWRSAGAGLLALLAFVPALILVTLLLVISCIGIPLLLLYPFVFVAILLGFLLGFAAVCSVVGQTLEARFGRRLGAPYAVLLLGLAAVMAPEIIARIFFLGDRLLGPLPELLLAFAVLVQFVAFVAGLGAVILTRFGTPPKPVAVPAPPVEPPPVYEPPAAPPPGWTPEPGS